MNDLQQANEYRAYEVRGLILHPPSWQRLALPVMPLAWNVKHVAATPPTQIPDNEQGVYTFVVQAGIANHPLNACLLYVGQAAGQGGFRARYYTYLAERNLPNSTRPQINRMINQWFDYLWFCYAVIPTAHIKTTEDELIIAYLPPFNVQFPARVSRAMRAFQ